VTTQEQLNMAIADEREHDCSALAADAIKFILDEIVGTKNTGYRGTTDLENEIYGWLWEHAVFDEDAVG